MLPLLVPPSALRLTSTCQIISTAAADVHEVVNMREAEVMLFLLDFVIFFPGIQNLLDQQTLLEKLIDPQREEKERMETRDAQSLVCESHNRAGIRKTSEQR